MNLKNLFNNKNKKSNSKVYIIAEIGHNHKGSLEFAKQLFLEAKNAGANAVKLQKRNNTQNLF